MATSNIALSATVGQTFSYTFQNPGTAAYSYTGDVPPGLTFNTGQNPSISGTPTSAGTYVSTWTGSTRVSYPGAKAISIPYVIVGGTSVTFTVTITVVAAASGTSSNPIVMLTWFQAEAYARGGGKIARIGWADRYLYFDGFLWWLQQFNAVTKVLGTLAVVQVGDFTPAEFRATDWVAAVGETIAADKLTELQAITTRFP